MSLTVGFLRFAANYCARYFAVIVGQLHDWFWTSSGTVLAPDISEAG
jgi:hypothetical protein